MPETKTEGVIARYLTVGGTTVELTYRLNVLSPPAPYATAADCTGCPASKEFGHWYGSGNHLDGSFEEFHDAKRATGDARAWAQSHAETCRAMPHPTA